MNITGRVLKASVVVGRDSTKVLLTLEVRDGDCDRLKATSDYVNQHGSIDLTEVPADHWDPNDEAPVPPLAERLADWDEATPDDEAPMGDSALND